jgi:hypothetical protein
MLAPLNDANSLSACQYSHGGEANEQSMLDDARYRAQQASQA